MYADEDGDGWYYDEWTQGCDGQYGCMSSASYNMMEYSELDPDNWIFSPAIDLSDATSPIFKIYAMDGGWYDQFQLCAGTAPNPDAMTVSSELLVGSGSWQQFSLDLSDLAGEREVYVAVRHCNSKGLYMVSVDGMSVAESAAADSATQGIKLPALGKAFHQIGHGSSMANVPVSARKVELSKMGETADSAVGSTNAVKDDAEPTGNTRQVTDCDLTTVEKGKARIVLGEDQNVTNGLLRISYDPAVLTLGETPVDPFLTSLHHDAESGTILFAYAAPEILQTGFCVLNFSFEGSVNTVVKVETLERNDNVAVEEDALLIPIVYEKHVCPCECFTDMPEYGTVEHAAIDWAYTQDPKVTNGTSKTKFEPNALVTRGQAVRFLWNAVGQPKPASTENPFKDAVQGRYYYDAMLWAYHNDPQITNGTSKTKFEPESTLLRSQIITFLWRTVGCPEPSIENPYSDVPAGRFFEKPAIWAYETGIFKGENGKFEPNAACTRADTVVFLYRHYTHQDLAE